jgi:hypothetical protein
VGAATAVGDLQDPTATIQLDQHSLHLGVGGSSNSSLGGRSRLLPVPSAPAGLKANTTVQFVRPLSSGARRSSDSLSMLPPGLFSGR